MSLSNTLLDPQLTEGYAIFIMGVFGILLYAGMRMYSPIVIVSWAMSVIIFIGAGVYNLPILLFYFALIVTVMLVAMASIRYNLVS